MCFAASRKKKKPRGGGNAVVELTENNFKEMVLESDEVTAFVLRAIDRCSLRKRNYPASRGMGKEECHGSVRRS